VRFVVLQKNASSYFDRPTYVAGKNLDEKSILNGIIAGLTPADINKGIKKLWSDGIIDSLCCRFCSPHHFGILLPSCRMGEDWFFPL